MKQTGRRSNKSPFQLEQSISYFPNSKSYPFVDFPSRYKGFLSCYSILRISSVGTGVEATRAQKASQRRGGGAYRVDILELSTVVVDRKVGRCVRAAALDSREVIRQRSLLLSIKPAEVDLLRTVPDVGLIAACAAVMSHAAEARSRAHAALASRHLADCDGRRLPALLLGRRPANMWTTV